MTQDRKQLMELLDRYRREEITEAEAREMFHLMNSEEAETVLADKVMEEARTAHEPVGLSDADWNRMWVEIAKKAARPVSAHRIHFLKTAWFRYAAAICVLLTGIALYYHFSHTAQPDTEGAQTTPLPVAGDAMPGYDRAVLTLSDGRQVTLDSTAAPTIKDGAVAIQNKDGQLTYVKNGAVAMNTMTTPAGGQYRLRLADSTTAWLNAASSITYPTAFTGQAREVTITGEVFFDVAKNAAQPFRVQTAHETIEVLGTRFNVNAYADEPAMKTSLLEGTVRVGNTVLKPGQAYVDGKVINTSVSQDIAWKNGLFDFNELTVEQAMRQIARWYDVRIAYEQRRPPDRLFGKVDRKLTLQELLEGFNGVAARFTLRGRTLTVRPL